MPFDYKKEFKDFYLPPAKRILYTFQKCSLLLSEEKEILTKKTANTKVPLPCNMQSNTQSNRWIPSPSTMAGSWIFQPQDFIMKST